MGLFDNLERRAWREDDDRWYTNLFGLKPTATGLRVDQSKAMTFAAVWACVRLLSETTASLPLMVYRRLTPRGKARAPDRPQYRVLHDMANPEMTAMVFRETMMSYLLLWGNAYAQIVRDRGGRVRELWPLHPARVRVSRNTETWQLMYTYYSPKPGQKPVDLAPEDVLHIPGLSFNGILGLNPIDHFRESVGLGLASEEFGARFFGNDARPGLVMTYPGQMSETAVDRAKKSIEDNHQGLGKSHRLMVLEEGTKLEQIGIPPATAQFLETRKFQVTEICRWFRVPPHMIYDLDRATFSNIEHQGLEFVEYSLRPWLVRWEQAILMKLFSADEQTEYFAEHLVEGLLRGDYKSRMEGYKAGSGIALYSINDMLEKENMNDIGPAGDIRLIPLNMGVMMPDGRIVVPSKEAASQAATQTQGEEGQNTNG